MIFERVVLLDNNNPNERHRIEESLKLKENILQSYRKQLDARRALLDFDNALMDITHETTRNESTIEQLVLEIFQNSNVIIIILIFLS